jgi:TATA-box binding protein (TBP) (component of TFIID and TFIIIB)
LKVEKREVRIQNVVATASFKHGIDLDAVVKAFPHAEYRPQVFPDSPSG